MGNKINNIIINRILIKFATLLNYLLWFKALANKPKKPKCIFHGKLIINYSRYLVVTFNSPTRNKS